MPSDQNGVSSIYSWTVLLGRRPSFLSSKVSKIKSLAALDDSMKIESLPYLFSV
ncbi:conserved hypothetical protein [delta proteobacterium NaphS2]|nr:conserved hypothetical protein [delta proteobacterium NaphS2]